MTKTNSKKALLSSAFALVLSVAMLIGTTFAWFTDTASTGVNKITSGNLHVEIQDKTGEKIENLEWVKENGDVIANQEDILWEPGCTYLLTPFQIVNTGNLALKYKIVITGLDGDSLLLDVIKFTYKTASGEEFDMSAEGHLAANGGTTGMITVSAHMDEAAGNKYQDQELTNVRFTVYATQDTVESDSFNNQYDANATYYPVIDFVGLKDALGKGGNITIAGDFTGDKTKTGVSDRLTIKTPTTLNFDGVYTVPGSLEASSNWAALYITDETTINAIDGAGIICEDKTDSSAAYIGGPYVADINAPSKTVTVNGGTYYGGGTTFQVTKGTLIVNGGFFQVTPDVDTHDCRYTLNCIDENYKNGSAEIIVKGGTFVNFDPSNNAAEGAGTNFVADGYSVISETKDNGDVWYTVVKGTGVVPSTQDEMNTGITDSSNKDVTVVMPANSSFTLDNGIAHEGNKSRNVTFVGDGSQTVDVAKNAPEAEGAKHLNYQRGSTFTFENLTIENGTDTYDGIVCDELTYKNCTIKGVTTLYGKATFINCVFENTMANQYSIWTWGGTDVTFENCTFNTNGKAILLFGEEKTTNLTVNNCTFNDRNGGAAGKAAIEIGEANNGKHNNFTVVINGSTVASGFALGQNTTSKLWANKNSMDAAHLTVTIDGNKVH